MLSLWEEYRDAMATWPGSGRQPHVHFDPRRLFAIGLLCGIAVVGVLLVTLGLRAANGGGSHSATRSAGTPQAPAAQRGRDAAAALSYRLSGRTVTVVAGRRSRLAGDLRGRRVSLQCGFLDFNGAALSEGVALWPRSGSRVSVLLDSRANGNPQFCELSRGTNGPALSRAVFGPAPAS
jgi:hypothetical protein